MSVIVQGGTRAGVSSLSLVPNAPAGGSDSQCVFAILPWRFQKLQRTHHRQHDWLDVLP